MYKGDVFAAPAADDSKLQFSFKVIDMEVDEGICDYGIVGGDTVIYSNSIYLTYVCECYTP